MNTIAKIAAIETVDGMDYVTGVGDDEGKAGLHALELAIGEAHKVQVTRFIPLTDKNFRKIMMYRMKQGDSVLTHMILRDNEIWFTDEPICRA